MSKSDQFDYSEKRTFLSRWGFAIGMTVVAAVGFFVFREALSGTKTTSRGKPSELVAIRPILPPPPPPPPPQTPPPEAPKQEMITQTPLNDQDSKPDDKPPDPSPALGTNIQGNGPPDGYGLGRAGGGSGSGGGGGGARGSQFGWYARQIQEAIADALRHDESTRDAAFNIRVRVWLDEVGRVTRVKLVDSTGNPALDATLRERALVGRQMRDPRPDQMPMPITIRLTLTRPN